MLGCTGPVHPSGSQTRWRSCPITVEQQHTTAGSIKMINTPMKRSETPVQVEPAAPRLGEHTQELLTWLGYDAAHVARLRQERVV